MTLQEIGLKYGTDKATHHLFCDTYDSYFSPLREQEINFLEIGIYTGQSIKMWEEYFKNGHIFGIDINNFKHLENDRIKTAICDQSNRMTLNNTFTDVEFDIILDDGGHKMDQQIISFGNLFKRLKSKGIYVIEDLHTSLYDDYRDYKPYTTSAMYLLNQFDETKNFDSEYLRAEEIKYLNENIESIKVFETNPGSYTSIIYKK